MNDETADKIVFVCREAFGDGFPYSVIRKVKFLGRTSVHLDLSLDARDTWANNIFENSRYLKLGISETPKGFVVETFVCWNQKARPRKATVKSLDKLPAKIGRIVATLIARSEGLTSNP